MLNSGKLDFFEKNFAVEIVNLGLEVRISCYVINTLSSRLISGICCALSTAFKLDCAGDIGGVACGAGWS